MSFTLSWMTWQRSCGIIKSILKERWCFVTVMTRHRLLSGGISTWTLTISGLKNLYQRIMIRKGQLIRWSIPAEMTIILKPESKRLWKEMEIFGIKNALTCWKKLILWWRIRRFPYLEITLACLKNIIKNFWLLEIQMLLHIKNFFRYWKKIKCGLELSRGLVKCILESQKNRQTIL